MVPTNPTMLVCLRASRRNFKDRRNFELRCVNLSGIYVTGDTYLPKYKCMAGLSWDQDQVSNGHLPTPTKI